MKRGLLVFKQSGFSSVEVVLAASVFALLVTALIGSYLYGEESTALSGNRARAIMFAEEGLEAVRNIRDSSFSNLVDGSSGLSPSGTVWNTAGINDTSDIFTRSVIISSIDANRKSVTSNVTWQQNAQRTGSISLTTYLTNWQRYVAIVSNWVTNTFVASMDLAGNNNGVKVQVVGDYAYVVRDDGTPDFLIIDVSTPSTPTLTGSLSLVGAPTNIFVVGDYAYVSSGDNAGELKIIDITDNTDPVLEGTYNASGNQDANDVYVVGTTAYLVKNAGGGNDDFLVINVSNPANPSLVGSLNTGDTGNELVVSGSYAYIASSGNSQELIVVNISTPATPTVAGSLNLLGNTNAVTITLAGSTLYIGQGAILFAINISTPASPSQTGSLAVGGTLNDIALNLGNTDTYLFIGTSDAVNEFKVINVATPAVMSLLSQQNITGTSPILGIAYDLTLDRAFLVSSSNTQEFIVIGP
jgi:Tfp pilus assembly protein PilV